MITQAIPFSELFAILSPQQQEEIRQDIQRRIELNALHTLHDDALVSLKDAALFLNISEDSVARLVLARRLKQVKFITPNQKGHNQGAKFRMGDLRELIRESTTGDVIAQDRLKNALANSLQRGMACLAEEHPFIPSPNGLVDHALIHLQRGHDLPDEALVFLTLDEALAAEWSDIEAHARLTAIVLSYLEDVKAHAHARHEHMMLTRHLRETTTTPDE